MDNSFLHSKRLLLVDDEQEFIENGNRYIERYGI